jgi:hypothetical protein
MVEYEEREGGYPEYALFTDLPDQAKTIYIIRKKNKALPTAMQFPEKGRWKAI